LSWPCLPAKRMSKRERARPFKALNNN